MPNFAFRNTNEKLFVSSSAPAPSETCNSPCRVFWWNEGYVSDGHDGLNFLALERVPKENSQKSFSFVFHGTQSWAIDSNPACRETCN